MHIFFQYTLIKIFHSLYFILLLSLPFPQSYLLNEFFLLSFYILKLRPPKILVYIYIYRIYIYVYMNSVAISVYCITLKLNLAVSCDSLIYFSIETLAAFAWKERIQFAKMAYKI